MAGGLPEPILISELVHLDHITIAGQTVEFRHVFYTWMAMLILFAVGWLVRRNISLVPGRMQNIFESIIGGLEDFTVTNMGEDGRKVFPVLGGLFLFIAVQNILGLIPACDAPTANINTNIGMALFVFLYYNYQGIKRWRGHYIHHFMGPMLPLAPFMMILEFISHLARPLSLTLRLFGNIFAEEMTLIIFFGFGASIYVGVLLGTVPMYFLFLLGKVLQAFILFILSMIYIQGSVEHAH